MIKSLLISLGTVLAAVLVGTAGITYLALELGEVAIVETRTPNGAPRYTHIWYVQEGETLYLEAGHPNNPWVRDLEHLQTLTLSGEGISGEYLFEPRPNAIDHERIRQMMRGKYGWRDRWIGVAFDTSRSWLIELEPAG